MFTYFGANDTEKYTAKAQRLPDKILGQWAKPAKRASEDLSERDRAQGFFGVWKIGEGDASIEYVFVEEDRSAASTEGDQNGHRGSWAKQGSELHITWDSGHYSIIREGNRGFSYKRVARVLLSRTIQLKCVPPCARSKKNYPLHGWPSTIRNASLTT